MSTLQQLMFLAFFPGLYILSSCASSKAAKSANNGIFMNQPVTIDGNDTEWPSPYPNYNVKSQISYIIANDKKHLYITIKISSAQIQQKVLGGGMSVWIDPGSKKEKTARIYYPLRNTSALKSLQNKDYEQRDFNRRTQMNDSGAEQKKHHQPPLPKDYTIEGFTACQGNFIISKTSACDIEIAMKRNDFDELVWEASIPLALIYPDITATQNTGKKPLTVGIEIGGIPMVVRPIGNRRGPGAPPEGEGMRTGGRPHGGGRMGGRPNDEHVFGENKENAESLSETTITWVKTAIAGL